MSERNPSIENQFGACGEPVQPVNHGNGEAIVPATATGAAKLFLKSQEERDLDSNWIPLGEAVACVVKQLAEKFEAKNSDKREVKHERANAA